MNGFKENIVIVNGFECITLKDYKKFMRSYWDSGEQYRETGDGGFRGFFQDVMSSLEDDNAIVKVGNRKYIKK